MAYTKSNSSDTTICRFLQVLNSFWFWHPPKCSNRITMTLRDVSSIHRDINQSREEHLGRNFGHFIRQYVRLLTYMASRVMTKSHDRELGSCWRVSLGCSSERTTNISERPKQQIRRCWEKRSLFRMSGLFLAMLSTTHSHSRPFWDLSWIQLKQIARDVTRRMLVGFQAVGIVRQDRAAMERHWEVLMD
jgi:hypothetical protein